MVRQCLLHRVPCSLPGRGTWRLDFRSHCGVAVVDVVTFTVVDVVVVVFIYPCYFSGTVSQEEMVIILLYRYPGSQSVLHSALALAGTEFVEVSDSILPPSLWTWCGCRKVEFRGVEVRPARLIDQSTVRLVAAAAANETFFSSDLIIFHFVSSWVDLIVIYLTRLRVT